MGLLLVLLLISSLGFAQQRITNEVIYQKLLDIEKKVIEIEKRQAIFEERFKQIDKRFEQIDKRFEQIDKRFEDMNNRIDDLFNFLYILSGVFTTFTVAVIGFVLWDRRTIIWKAKEETLKDEKIKALIESLRTLSSKDEEVARILRKYNLL